MEDKVPDGWTLKVAPATPPSETHDRPADWPEQWPGSTPRRSEM